MRFIACVLGWAAIGLRRGLRLCARYPLVAPAAVLVWLAAYGWAATVEPGIGYTNDFSAWPAAADWSTRSIGTTAGASDFTTAAALEAAVQTNTAALITTRLTSATGNPPSATSLAVWSSAGLYLQTRPSGNAATLLMATLVNNTGTNATAIRLMYDFVTNRASLVAEEVRGHRVYYSLSGAANSWVNLPDLSHTPAGRLSVDLTLAAPWTNGGTLYLLWADDNGSGTPDDANNIDNFFLTVIGGTPLAASCRLTAPAHGQSFGAPAVVTLTAAASPGPGATVTGVGFFEVTAGRLASVLAAPYTTDVTLMAGTYALYAVATNSLGVRVFSETNTITVTNRPLGVVVNTPTNGQSFAETTFLSATATVAGGAAPYAYAVTFYTNVAGGPVGALAASGAFPTFTAALGVLPEGTYQIYAEATDGATTARSATNTFTTVGPIKVPITGLTLTFDTAPPPQKWSTFSLPGSSTTDQSLADMDASMTTNGAANITSALPTQTGSATNSRAYWRSGDQKLGTQPTGNRATLLMATLVNATGEPVAQLDVAYTFGLASVTPAETNKGHRVYFSPTGATNSWTPLGFFELASPGTVPVSFSITGLNWAPGALLYLVWLDDNGDNPDGDYTIDDITFRPIPAALNVTVTAPTNGQVFVAGTPITAAAAVASGTAPYVVRFYTNSGVGNRAFVQAGPALTAPPFAVELGLLPAGAYNLYATVTDQGGAGSTAVSRTNTFTVADPLGIVLTAPANGASFDWQTSLGATGVVSGGTAPYTVRFFTNNVLAGVADGNLGAAWFKDLGRLFMGVHTVQARVTDANGWAATSGVHTVTITGPLFASLAPAHGASFNYGTAVTLTGTVDGGTAPYTAVFFTNGQFAGSSGPGSSPFILPLGILPVGSHAVHLAVSDAAGAVTNSATNVLTILPNPLTVLLTAPASGQVLRPGQAMTATATASVGAPLTVTGVEFFLDGVSIGVDSAAPYSASLSGASEGRHTVYAMATDSLGRRSFSTTNTFEVLNLPEGILVGPGGHTNTFDTQPPASEWSTRSFGSSGVGGSGEISTAAELDAAVQTNAASLITWQLPSATGTPPSASSNAVWASAGFYLQTRPTTCAATLLMATLVNSTGTNAWRVRVLYDYTTNRAALLTEEVRGHRVYYSLSGAPNSWVFIPELSHTAQGTLSVEVTLAEVWAHGTRLYLLWADDNGSGGPGDDANNIDNFFVGVTAGTPIIQPLAVTVTSPASGARFQAPADILLEATVSGEPAPTNVQFYANATLVGAASTSPFRAQWSQAPGGDYLLRAVARNSNGSFTSAPVAITVTNLWAGTYELVAADDQWRYLDDGSDQGTAWVAPAFDDSGWPSGHAPLGYGHPALDTTVRSNRTDGTRILTTYFRHTFVVNDQPAAFAYMVATLLRNDGAVVYLNGMEILRDNLPPGPVDFQTLALTNAPPSDEVLTVQVPASLLVPGANVLAAEVHLSDPANTDLTFALALEAIVTNAPPRVSITSPPHGVVYYLAAPTNLPITAAAADLDGTVAKVDFYLSGEKLGEDAAAPFSAVWSNAFRNGAYYLQAVATDNFGLSATSDVVSVILICSVPPSVSLLQPVEGATFLAPTNLALLALVVESGGAVTNVAFFSDATQLLGNVSAPPWGLTWSNPPLGYYALTAVARDDGGLSSTSAPVNVAVLNPMVRISSPAHGTRFVAPVAVAITAEAAPGVTNVALYINGAKWADDAAAPYAWTWSQAPLGTHRLTAVALDSAGLAHTSAPVAILVAPNAPPTVTLTAPANNAIFLSPTNVTLTATATDDDGVAKVEFFAGSSRLGERTFSPYSLIWTNPPLGEHVLTAVATDIYGLTNRSAPLTIIVAQTVVTRGPYLGNRGETNITIRWRTAAATDSRVRYGPSPDNLLWAADDPAIVTDHSVTLTGLRPETKYYYWIGTTAGPLQTSTNYFFSTAPPIGTSRPMRILVLSDQGRTSTLQTQVRDTYLNLVSSSGRQADLWLSCGDNEQTAFTGTDALFQTMMFNVYSNILQNTPFVTAAGNHDGLPSSALWTIFDLPSDGVAGGTPSGTEYYYSFDYGDIHFICLDSVNSSRATNGAMLTWLRQDLERTTQRWIIAYWHHPAYCKVFYDSDTDTTCREMRENVNPILEAYGVDLVLNGHTHSHQRTYLLQRHYGLSTTFHPTNKVDGGDGRVDGTGPYLKPGRTGTVYVAGPTGCDLTRSGPTTHPACLYTINNTAGFMLIDVNSNRLDLRMITSTGTTGDYFTIIKGPSQTVPPAVPANFTVTTNVTSAILTWANNATNEVSYHLERSVNGSPFTEIAVIGANLTTFTNTGLDWANSYAWRLRAWNNAGYSGYSAVASVTPPSFLVIDQQPQDVTALVGETAVFRVQARGGGPLTYQWYHSLTALPGATNSTLVLPNVQPEHAGYYWVVVYSGGMPLLSDVALLTVVTEVLAPRIIGSPRVTNDLFIAAFQGTPGLTYTIEFTDALGAPWQKLRNVTVPPSGLILLEENIRLGQRRFYRLVYPPQ